MYKSSSSDEKLNKIKKKHKNQSIYITVYIIFYSKHTYHNKEPEFSYLNNINSIIIYNQV